MVLENIWKTLFDMQASFNMLMDATEATVYTCVCDVLMYEMEINGCMTGIECILCARS